MNKPLTFWVVCLGTVISWFFGLYDVSWEIFWKALPMLFLTSAVYSAFIALHPRNLREWRNLTLWRDLAFITLGIPATVLATALIWRLPI